MASAPALREAFEADFTFEIIGMELDDLKVTAFTGEEAMSDLFRFRVEVCSDNPDVSFDQTIGKPCTLAIYGTQGERFVNGIVRRFERLGEGVKLAYYAAEIVPVHWLLTKRCKSRIFQEHNCPGMKVPDIVKKVLDDAGIPSDAYSLKNVTKTYPTREYVVQYRESDFDFISRLMEEEGIFYFFEHTAIGHVMVIADKDSAHKTAAGAETVPFRERNSLVADQNREVVYSLRDRQEVQTGAVSLDDFNFEKVSTDLYAERKADKFTSLEWFDYPGRYVEKKDGDALVQTRLEEFQVSRRIQKLEAGVKVLLPGFKFTLEEHPIQSLNREYLVTQVSHRARQGQSGEAEGDVTRGFEYNADIRTVWSDVPFRPERSTEKPTVLGSQTALVVGPSGEELYTDKYGRVKVQFHWDREGAMDEKSSCWIRVSQGLAGGGYGHMFLPRVGQEVIVDFLEGDPDRPIITGRVYNNDHMPAYTLPSEKTKSYIKTHSSKGGGGTNEIRFEDKKGSEQLLFHAQKNLHTRVKSCEAHTVGGSRSVGVGGDQYSKIGGDRHGWVVGDEIYAVSGNRWLGISGNLDTGVSGNHALAVGGEYVVGARLIVMEGDTGICLKGPGGFISIDAAGITIKGNVVLINSGGAALTASYGGQSKQPKEPAAADNVQPGRDTRYSAEGRPFPPVEVEEMEERKTFVEFQLLDVHQVPVANEPFIVQLPDGTQQSGTTDGEGKCRFEGIDVGNARIMLPNRKNAEWQRIRIVPAQA